MKPLRIEYPGAVYHITSRGNGRADIYLDDKDRAHFIELFGQVSAIFNWSCYTYCLMDNHYHLVIETRDANLSRGMRQLNSVYCQRFNQRHRRVGHVLQGRYKGILVDKESYLLELVRYVILNPVRAQMTKTAGQWKWSSYRAMIGKCERPSWLDRDWMLSHFGSSGLKARKGFIEFIMEGRLNSDMWDNLRQQIYLGDEEFVERMLSHVECDTDLSEIVKEQRCNEVRPIEWYEAQCQSRNEAIVMAFQLGGFTQKALADYFELHYSSISKILNSCKLILA